MVTERPTTIYKRIKGMIRLKLVEEKTIIFFKKRLFRLMRDEFWKIIIIGKRIKNLNVILIISFGTIEDK